MFRPNRHFKIKKSTIEQAAKDLMEDNCDLYSGWSVIYEGQEYLILNDSGSDSKAILQEYAILKVVWGQPEASYAVQQMDSLTTTWAIEKGKGHLIQAITDCINWGGKNWPGDVFLISWDPVANT